MKKVAKNSVVKNEVKEVVTPVVENVESVEEEKTMENTTTRLSVVQNFKVERVEFTSKRGNKVDMLSVTFEGKPEREIINRIKEKGFSFSWSTMTWSTFGFNTSKEPNREGKENELKACEEFIKATLSAPLTMTEEEANDKAKEIRKANSSNKRSSSKGTKKNTPTKEKSKETAKKGVKKADKVSKSEPKSNEDKANEIKKYIKGTLGMDMKTFKALPKETQALLLASMQ